MSTSKKVTTIALILTFALTSVLAIVPTTHAHDPPWTITTYAYCNVAPNPAGLGQTVTVGFWLQVPPPTASGALGDRWHNLKVTVTKPDGSSEVLGPFSSDATGGTFTTYTPSALGNYTFVFSFPGQNLTNENPAPPLYPGQPPNEFIGDYFAPSTSQPAKLTVQQEAIPTIPQNPLPTSFWTRPVQSVNGRWYTLTGNWLGLGRSTFTNTGLYNISGNYNPYTQAPNTAHILWTKPEAFGGLVGGEFGGSETSNYYSTSQYEPKYAPIIMSGILYYEQYPGSSTNPTGWVAVDLRTGQTIWTKNTTDSLRCGQELNYVSPNQYGNIAYLWATPFNTGVLGTETFEADPGTYTMYDALTGNYILGIVDSPGMLITEDEHGNLIGYYVNTTMNFQTFETTASLTMWNSTQAIQYPEGYVPGVTVPNWQWRPRQNQVIPFSSGIMWSVPLPSAISGVPLPDVLAVSTVQSGVVLLTTSVSLTLAGFNTGYQIEAGYNAATGQQLWITNRTETPFTQLFMENTAGSGVYIEVNHSTAVATGYSLSTGTKLWTTQLTDANPYTTIGGYQSVVANGVDYLWGFGGEVYAIDMATGDVLWQTTSEAISGNAGSDTPYGIWPLWTFTVGTVADGKLFIPEGHMYSPPLFRGAKQLAINTTNGKPVWSILSFDVTSGPAISDGIMTTFNAYDNQIYAYGKGPSKVTVTAPNVGVTTATPIIISGTITDESAGSQRQDVAANFPNGLPCVSDEVMTSWMEYVYMQQPRPVTVTGVPITIDVIDANQNYRTIGSVTSGASGKFAFTWTPDIPGDFTVIATFKGSESYYSSTDQGFFTVTEAPQATATPTQPPASIADQYFLPMSIGMIIAIVVVIILVLVMLVRKR